MFRKCLLVLAIGICFGTASAGYQVSFDFETAWSGDYADGWINAAYRHGVAPIGKMMQQTTQAYEGSYGMQLIADSTPQSWMWWAAVEPENVDAYAMQKQFNPWFSAYYYDDLSVGEAGQIYSVPSWVDLYIGGTEDWTDTQFGARYNVTDNYYHVATGDGHPGWQNTGVARTLGWHQLKMQLSSVDGAIHYYIDGTEVGSSYRSDYIDLTTLGLYTMFQAPLSGWTDKPYTIWDKVEFGSTYVPAPGALLLGALGTSLLGWVRRRA